MSKWSKSSWYKRGGPQRAVWGLLWISCTVQLFRGESASGEKLFLCRYCPQSFSWLEQLKDCVFKVGWVGDDCACMFGRAEVHLISGETSAANNGPSWGSDGLLQGVLFGSCTAPESDEWGRTEIAVSGWTSSASGKTSCYWANNLLLYYNALKWISGDDDAKKL